MTKIPVKYIDTTKYKVTVHDDSDNESPNEWGCFEVKIFGCNDLNNAKREDFYDDNDNISIGLRTRLRFGTAFPVQVKHYSNADGGYYTVTDLEDADGFILFDTDYVRGESFERRREYAKGDLETYGQWCNGDIYYVTIETDYGKEIDAVGGLYGTEGINDFIKEVIGDAEYTAIGKDSNGKTYEVSL